jgi:hypothetical protein
MENPVKDGLLKFRPTPLIPMIIVSAFISIMTSPPLLAEADNQKAGNGSQELGSKMGQFMNSFMGGLDSSSTSKEPDKEVNQRQLIPSTKQGRQRKRAGKLYDPWGVTPQRDRSSAFRYDPWGVTNNTRNYSRFADRDWALEREYYGDSLGARNRSGYYLPPQGYPPGNGASWNRNTGQYQPQAPMGYPYYRGGNESPGWGW